MTDSKPLKLVLKCIDDKEFGRLYSLNKKISDEELDKIKEYMRFYSPEDFKDIMTIEGNPHGWMCQEKDVVVVEKILGITETMEKQRNEKEERRRILDERRFVKDDAMDKIEKIFTNAPRPAKFLKKLLKKSKIVYDPGDRYYFDHEYGEGQLFLIEENYVWYIINNGGRDDNYELNNIKTGGRGAVGFRVGYSDELHDLIKIVSDGNLYKG